MNWPGHSNLLALRRPIHIINSVDKTKLSCNYNITDNLLSFFCLTGVIPLINKERKPGNEHT